MKKVNGNMVIMCKVGQAMNCVVVPIMWRIRKLSKRFILHAKSESGININNYKRPSGDVFCWIVLRFVK